MEDKEYRYRQNKDFKKEKKISKEIEEFHRRRIHCVLEMFSHVYDSNFFPITSEEITSYKKMVADYGNQKSNYETLNQFALELRKKIPVNNTREDLIFLTSEFFTFWGKEDILDWGYSQYFEIALANLDKFVDEKTLILIMQKHFSDVLSEPVKRIMDIKYV